MTNIANHFNSKLYYNKGNSVYFSANTEKNNPAVEYYFSKYPLMTSKYLNYLCYKEGLSYKGRRLNQEEISKIRLLKGSMNSKRIYYN
jgi:hypothetical protein